MHWQNDTEYGKKVTRRKKIILKKKNKQPNNIYTYKSYVWK